MALKEAGIKDVKIYFGSWNDGSRDPSLPIETGAPASMKSAALTTAHASTLRPSRLEGGKRRGLTYFPSRKAARSMGGTNGRNL